MSNEDTKEVPAHVRETAMAMDPQHIMLCSEYGHVPLRLLGAPGPSFVGVQHKPTKREFARLLFCTRCGGVYWEPQENV